MRAHFLYSLFFFSSAICSAREPNPLIDFSGKGYKVEHPLGLEVKVTVRLVDTKFEYDFDFGKLEDKIFSHDTIRSEVKSCAPALTASAKSLKENRFSIYFRIESGKVENIGYSSKDLKGFAFSEGSQFRNCLIPSLKNKILAKSSQ